MRRGLQPEKGDKSVTGAKGLSFSLAVREKVWDRAGGMCERKMPTGQRCFAPGSEFHHIILKKMGGRQGKFKELSDSEANCMLVCLGCHKERHDGAGWNDDAAELVPGREVRDRLEKGGSLYGRES